MKKDRIVTLRLDEATYQRLKSLADRNGTSLSETIRRHLVAPQPTVTWINPYVNGTHPVYRGGNITWTPGRAA